MPTSPQYTLQSQDVYTCTITTLDTLPLHKPGAIDSRALLRVLVCAAASRLSVPQAGEQLARAPSGPTVLGILAAQLSALDALEGQGNDLLAQLMPQGLGKRGRRVAVAGHPERSAYDPRGVPGLMKSTATVRSLIRLAVRYVAVAGHRSDRGAFPGQHTLWTG